MECIFKKFLIKMSLKISKMSKKLLSISNKIKKKRIKIITRIFRDISLVYLNEI